MRGTFATVPGPEQIARRVDVKLRRWHVRQNQLIERQSARQILKSHVAFDLQCTGEHPARQNERRSGMSIHPTRSDPAPGTTPARDQSRDIPTLEIDEIDRQQQDSGGMPGTAHA